VASVTLRPPNKIVFPIDGARLVDVQVSAVA